MRNKDKIVEDFFTFSLIIFILICIMFTMLFIISLGIVILAFPLVLSIVENNWYFMLLYMVAIPMFFIYLGGIDLMYIEMNFESEE